MRATAARLVPAAAWLAIILVVSSLPLGGLSIPAFEGADKIAHFCEYLVLGFLAVAGLGWGVDRSRGLFLRALAAVPIMALTACADEWHQRWIPGRSSEVLDLAMDLAGILAGSVVAMLVLTARRPGKR